MRWLIVFLLLLPTTALAQVASETLAPAAPADNSDLTPPEDAEPVDPDAPRIIAPPTELRPIAHLRGLDKMTGRVEDIFVETGTTLQWERLEIAALTCRQTVPGEKPDAYAWLEIRDIRNALPSFVGWMIASSPGINAMDHPRYDVWVTSCSTSSGAAETGSANQSD